MNNFCRMIPKVGLQFDIIEASAVQVDPTALEQLMSMGFGEVRCTKALLATGNQGSEIAMNWLFEHMEDPGIDY